MSFLCWASPRQHGKGLVSRRAPVLPHRLVLPQLLGVLFVGGMVLAIGDPRRAGGEEPPNLIVVLTDDQGYGDVGCFGSEKIATPHLDRMAAEGTKLTSFYVAAPICTPTRAALMTGCYASRVGLETPLHVYDRAGLHPDERTIAEALQQLDYRTGCIGKWHLGHRPAHYPTRHGFDVYWGTPLGHMFDRPEVGRAVGDASDLFLDQEVEIPFPAHEVLTQSITEKAVEFIHDHRDQPFFLFVSHPLPHEPLAVSESFAGQSAAGLYGDVIECLDWSIGQILEAIDQHGLGKNTIVVFTSDNGPKQGHGSAGPLRGFKHQPYEGGVRVPCIVWGPGRVPAGSTLDEIATIMDLYPTFVTLGGGQVFGKQALDGRDLFPWLLGDQQTAGPHREFFYFVRHGVLAGVRQGRWKLLLQSAQPAELYDLQSDLAESHNVAAERPEIVGQLQQRMAEFERQIQQTRRGPAGRYRP